MKKIINTPKAPAAIGPYSQAVLAGNTLYISGQIPINPATKEVPEGITAQTEQVMQNIKAIHDLLEFNVEKIRQNNYCWYCGKEMEPSKLTKDHVFPRSKGGDNDMDNIIMVCKTCNSSKGDMDLFEWYAEVRKEWPPINVFVHYLKNIYLYSIENGLMDKHSEELDAMDLPFNWRYIPIDYPQPEVYM